MIEVLLSSAVWLLLGAVAAAVMLWMVDVCPDGWEIMQNSTQQSRRRIGQIVWVGFVLLGPVSLVMLLAANINGYCKARRSRR